MPIISRVFLTLILPFSVFSNTALSSDFPERSNVYVNDHAFVLNEKQKTTLQITLSNLQKETGVEMIVVSIYSRSMYRLLDPMASLINSANADTIEKFSRDLFKHWELSDKTVLILVSKVDREMRIHLGSDYGTAYDHDLKRIVDGVFIPHFKTENYGEGIISGVNATLERLINNVMPQSLHTKIQAKTQSPKTLSSIDSEPAPNNINAEDWLVNILLVGVVFTMFYYFYLGPRRRPKCNQCKTKMLKLNENDDDAYLELGSQLEEIVGSVDYVVWKCATCDAHKIVRFDKWFSGYGACRECGYKTLESIRAVLSSPTEYKTGKARIIYRCETCDFEEIMYETIPRISRDEGSSSFSSGSSYSSSSSSSSSSESSSSGGASGSW